MVILQRHAAMQGKLEADSNSGAGMICNQIPENMTAPIIADACSVLHSYPHWHYSSLLRILVEPQGTINCCHILALEPQGTIEHSFYSSNVPKP